MEFPGQGSNPSCTMAIPDPLTHSVRMGIEPASWCCRDTAHPIAPQQEFYLTEAGAEMSLTEAGAECLSPWLSWQHLTAR